MVPNEEFFFGLGICRTSISSPKNVFFSTGGRLYGHESLRSHPLQQANAENDPKGFKMGGQGCKLNLQGQFRRTNLHMNRGTFRGKCTRKKKIINFLPDCVGTACKWQAASDTKREDCSRQFYQTITQGRWHLFLDVAPWAAHEKRPEGGGCSSTNNTSQI